MKIPIELVVASLKKYEVDASTTKKIIEDLQIEAQPDPTEEKSPTVKKQWVILVSDKDGILKDKDLVGWVLQIEESESVATTQDRIFRSAYDYNASKRGQQFPVSSIGEALEVVPAKFCKEHNLWIKSHTPVLVLKTDNVLPKE